MITVNFATSITHFQGQFSNRREARQAARDFVQIYYRKDVGEKFVKLSKDSWAIRHVAGGTLVVASVTP